MGETTDETTKQPAQTTRDNGRVAVRIIVAVAVAFLSLVDLLVSSQSWMVALDVAVIVIAVAYAIGKSWARLVMGLVVVLTTFGYGLSAISGGGEFAITNTLIWGALLLGIWYVSGELTPKHPDSST